MTSVKRASRKRSEFGLPSVSSAPVKRRRSLLKTVLVSVGVLLGAIATFCIVLAIVNRPTPEQVAAQKSAQAQRMIFANQYAGQWGGQDGTDVIIRGNGGADFNMGNTSVEGGSAHWDAQGKTLTIRGLFGIHQTWQIAEPPHRTGEGHTEMTLGGVLYRRMDTF